MDLWLHLRVGRAALAGGGRFGLPDPLTSSGTCPTHPASGSARSRPTGLHELLGDAGIQAFRLLLVSCSSARSSRVPPGGRADAGGPVDAARAYGTTGGWSERPQLAGLALVAVRTPHGSGPERPCTPRGGSSRSTWVSAGSTDHGRSASGSESSSARSCGSTDLRRAPGCPGSCSSPRPGRRRGAHPAGAVAPAQPVRGVGGPPGTCQRVAAADMGQPPAAGSGALHRPVVYVWAPAPAATRGEASSSSSALAATFSAVRTIAVGAILLAPLARPSPRRRSGRALGICGRVRASCVDMGGRGRRHGRPRTPTRPRPRGSPLPPSVDRASPPCPSAASQRSRSA